MPYGPHEPPEASIGGHVDSDIRKQHAHERPEEDDEEADPARGPEQIDKETEAVGDIGIEGGGVFGDEMAEDGALPETDEGAVDPMVVVGDGVDESAESEPKANCDEVVHGSCPERRGVSRALGERQRLRPRPGRGPFPPPSWLSIFPRARSHCSRITRDSRGHRGDSESLYWRPMAHGPTSGTYASYSLGVRAS